MRDRDFINDEALARNPSRSGYFADFRHRIRSSCGANRCGAHGCGWWPVEPLAASVGVQVR
jgi:hypothetical protein